MFERMTSTWRAARLATFGYFALNGFVLGIWIVHIPSIEHRAGVSHAVLGWLLLLLGAGAFAGMRLVGPLTDRFGARPGRGGGRAGGGPAGGARPGGGPAGGGRGSAGEGPRPGSGGWPPGP